MSKMTLYRLMKAGDVKAYRRGTRTLIDLDSLAAYNSGLEVWTPKEGHAEHMRRIKAEAKARKAGAETGA